MRVRNKKRLVVMLYNVIIEIYWKRNILTVDAGLAASYDLLLELQEVLLHASHGQHFEARMVINHAASATTALGIAPISSFGQWLCATLSIRFDRYAKVLIVGLGHYETPETLSTTKSSSPAPKSARALLQQL